MTYDSKHEDGGQGPTLKQPCMIITCTVRVNEWYARNGKNEIGN